MEESEDYSTLKYDRFCDNPDAPKCTITFCSRGGDVFSIRERIERAAYLEIEREEGRA